MTTRRCPRCGEAFTLDAPTKARRLCDACRAERATFFVCGACGIERETHSATRDAERQPVQCWDCRQADEAAARTALIAEHVRRLEPGLARHAIEDAIGRAAPSRVERKWLAEHLAAHPDALTSGAANAPRVVGRFAHALVSAGAQSVRLPCCALCGRPAVLVTTTSAGRACATCGSAGRTGGCATCGQVRRVAARLPHGGAVCRTCRGRDTTTWEACAYCGERRRVNARTASGEPVCTSCYSRHLQRPRHCDGCGATALITATTDDGRSLCGHCYLRPPRPCGICGRVRRIKVRATAEHPDLCGACHWGTWAACTRCQEFAEGFGIRRGAHVCLRCTARQRVEQLLAAPDGRVPNALGGLRDAFLAADQPRSVFVWLDRSPGARVLRRLVDGDLALSHDALDQLPQSASVRHLRQLLVATAALPERDPYLAGVERAAAKLVASLEQPDDAKLLRAFARWGVLHRLRRRASDQDVTAHAAKNARSQLAETARFLAWLRRDGRSLAECRQADVDKWLDRDGRNRQLIRPLLEWAADRGHAPADLDLPWQRSTVRPRAVDHDTRWALARRLLHEDDLDAADRVVGAFVVLYAQPLARVARLRVADIDAAGSDVYVSFGKDAVHMPGPLGELLRRLPWRRQIGPSGMVDGAGDWLFPGRQAGRPQHPEYLAARLRAIGIEPRAHRSAALLQLGAELPPAVLADLLNLHPTTAVRWVRAANGDWANYAADRAREATTEERS